MDIFHTSYLLHYLFIPQGKEMDYLKGDIVHVPQ